MASSSPMGTRAAGISLDDLYRLHAAGALRVARSITHSPEDAADAVSEAFAGVLAAVSRGRLIPSENLKSYLLAATRNAAIDIVRRSGRVQPTDRADDVDHVVTAAGPSDRLLAGEDRLLVTRAYATLPPRWRAVLWLTEVEGLPPRDAAPLLRLTPNNVAQLATRARARLRRQYVQGHVGTQVRGDCAETTELLGGLVAAELTATQANRVRGHLAECAACGARLADLEDLGLSLRRTILPPALPATLAALRRWRPRWPFGHGRHGIRVWAAAVDPTAAATHLEAAVQLGGSPAAQQVAAAVVAGLLVLGVGTAVVRQDGSRAAVAPPPVAQMTAAVPPSAASRPAPAVGPSTTTTSATAPDAPPAAAPPGPGARPAAFSPRGPLATAVPSAVAHAVGSQLPVFDGPGTAVAARVLSNPRSSGAPLVLLVVDQRPGWLQVLLPVRPNGSTGWVRASDVSVTSHDFRILVELGAHRITAYQGTQVLLSEPIAVGTAEAPTPGGLYYVTELFQPLDLAGRLDPAGPYGPYAYGLSGYSEVLYDFAGGDGQFGIHGTNEPDLLGQDVSHGCLRMSNAGITRLAGILPLGVPVEILP